MKLLVAILALLLNGCSGCSSNGSAKDAGSDTNTGADTDTDSDTDTDTDSDTDTDTDSDTDADGFVADAGPWDWTDLPATGDCGVVGCRQLTFSDEVRFLEWDVWDDLLTFKDETRDTLVVNHQEGKQLLLPNPYPQYPIGTMFNAINFYPSTIYEKMVCYSKVVGSETDIFTDVICADLESETQKLVYHRPKVGDDFPNPAKYIDVYGDRIVSMGGCGDVMDSWPLCVFDRESPSTYEEVAPSNGGSHYSLWGDVVVWYTNDMNDYDIRAYDFFASQFTEITDDTEIQLHPRIHGDRVVYMDLQFGDSGGMGNWNHSAVFMYEISTGTTTQITSGAWIACYPDVHDNIIIWSDYRDAADPNDGYSFAGVQIWGYNIDTSTEFQITDIPSRPKQTPRIWGDKVFVDMAKTTGGNAIYMFDLPPAAK